MTQLFVLVGFAIFVIFFVHTLIIRTLKSSTKSHNNTSKKLPPGKTGWPIIGETLKYVSNPEEFMRERMNMHSQEVFKTSLAGEKMAVFCGPKANKFLFSNEGTNITRFWIPRSVSAILSYPNVNNDNSPTAKPLDELTHSFLKKDYIQKYVSVVHSMVRQHVQTNWSLGKEIEAFTVAKEFVFSLSCKVLIDASVEQVKDLINPFFLALEGLVSAPINFPGTPYYKAVKGGKLIREKLVRIIKERRCKISLNKNHYYDDDANQPDLLTQLIVDYDKNGKLISEEDLATKIIGLMFAGFYPTSSTIAFAIGNLAQHPDVYERVLQEQRTITESKELGELLTWADIQKMKYTWNVICETMRLASPVPGNFREVKTDFSYAGFTIPKGWKIHWSLHTTQKNPEYFPNPEKFEPSRFEGHGPAPYTFVPFGAGSRMCAGKELARIEMLVFLHNVITKFRFKKVNLNEKIIYNPDPIPEEGLRVLLQSNA